MQEAELRPNLVKAILLGGLAVGVLDAIDAMTFFGLAFGVAPARIWQSVASGIYGREAAVAGGLTTASIGLCLHFLIAFIIATVYNVVSLKLSLLLRRPIFSGLLYGVICYFVMSYVVVPLSNATKGAFVLSIFLNGVIGHALLVGLPIALIARWSAKKST